MAGNPFSGHVFGDQRIMFHLLTKILRLMNGKGWKLVASADVSSKYVNRNNQPPQPLDTHSWFFLKDPEMVLPPGTVGVQVREEANEGTPEIMEEADACGGAARNWILCGFLCFILLALAFFIVYMVVFHSQWSSY